MLGGASGNWLCPVGFLGGFWWIGSAIVPGNTLSNLTSGDWLNAPARIAWPPGRQNATKLLHRKSSLVSSCGTDVRNDLHATTTRLLMPSVPNAG